MESSSDGDGHKGKRSLTEHLTKDHGQGEVGQLEGAQEEGKEGCPGAPVETQSRSNGSTVQACETLQKRTQYVKG